MSTQNYPGNSKSRGEKPKIEKIVSGEVKSRRRPLGKRVVETFAGEDIPSIGEYILYEIIIPGVRDILYDSGVGGLGQFLGVNNRRRSGNAPIKTNPAHISYESYSQKNTSIVPSRPTKQSSRTVHADFVLATRAEAEEVLDQMRTLLDQYESITVADLKSYLGIKVEYTDDAWGWKDLREARIMKDRDGYILDLPRTIEIR